VGIANAALLSASVVSNAATRARAERETEDGNVDDGMDCTVCLSVVLDLHGPEGQRMMAVARSAVHCAAH
jgi:nitrous oxide reductase accessory protein NosL